MLPLRVFFGLLGASLLALHAQESEEFQWTPLFNGKDLAGWNTFLTEPEPGVRAPDLARDANGRYVEAHGLNRDPLGVFTVVEADGQPAIRVSGEVFGMLISEQTYGDYVLELEFKWGEKKWAPRLEVVRDSGLLYHGHGPYRAPGASRWMASQEFQIQEGDCGDYWCVGETAAISIPARKTGEFWQFVDGATLEEFRYGPNRPRRVLKAGNFEKPHGEWNTLQLVALGGQSIHVVNGEVVMRLYQSRQAGPGGDKPLTRGHLILQSEGAEVFFRNLRLRPIQGWWGQVDKAIREAPERTEYYEPAVRKVTAKPGQPPSDAVVLFDGKNLTGWESVNGGPAQWTVKDGAMTVAPGTGAIRTKELFGDCQLHIEWMCVPGDEGSGQGNGNSGVFFMGDRYEVQVLNSHGNDTYVNGQAGSLYKQHPPLVNAARPAGEWQTYDILFTAPRFDAEGRVLQPARFTVLHNGVVVQNGAELWGPTAYIGLPEYRAHAGALPIQLQDHSDLVSYRNIWARRL